MSIEALPFIVKELPLIPEASKSPLVASEFVNLPTKPDILPSEIIFFFELIFPSVEILPVAFNVIVWIVPVEFIFWTAKFCPIVTSLTKVELGAETFKLSETDKSLTVILFRSKLLPLKVIELLTVKSSNNPEFDLIESETFKSPEVKVNLLLIFKLPEKSKDIILDFTVDVPLPITNAPLLTGLLYLPNNVS